MAIFEMAAVCHLVVLEVGNINFRFGSEAKYAPQWSNIVPIGQTVIKNMSDFLFFKMSAVCHFGFLKVGNFTFLSALEGHCASLCQILRQLVKVGV